MTDPTTPPETIRQLDYLFSSQGLGESAGGTTDQRKIEQLDFLFGKAPQPEQSDLGTVSRGVVRGVKHLQASGSAMGATVAAALSGEEGDSMDFLSDSLVDNYHFYSAEAEKFAGTVDRVEDINSASTLITWLADRASEQIPNMAGFIITGGFGGVVAKLAQKGAMTAAERAVITQIAPKILPPSVVARGQLAGGFGFSSVMEGGGIAGEQIDEGFELEPGVVLPMSLISGALETFSAVVALKAVGLSDAFKTTFMQNLRSLPLPQRMAATASLVGVNEAGTETLQELNALTARTIVDENYETLGEEGRSRLLNAGLAGFAVGGLFGGVGGVLPGEGGNREKAPTPEPELDVTTGERNTEGSQAQPSNGPINSDVTLLGNKVEAATNAGQFGLDRIAQQVTMGNELDAEFNSSQETRVERLVEDHVEAVPLSEATPVVLEAQDRAAEVLGQEAEFDPEQNQIVDVTGDNTVEYRNLNEAQNKRLTNLNTKLEEEGDLSTREWDTYVRLQELATQDVTTNSVEKLVVPELDKKADMELANEIVDSETVRQRSGASIEDNSTIRAQMVRNTLDSLAKIFPGAPPVQGVRLKDMVGDKTVYDNGRGARGLYVDRGKGPEIFVFTNANATPGEVTRTYLHEVIGHGGIRSLFNEKDLKSFLKLINKNLVTADEYVARLAEQSLNPRNKDTTFRRVLAWMRQWLRRMGMDIKLTDDEIRAVLRNARSQFMSTVTQGNYAQLHNIRSPKTLDALRTNNEFLFRFLEHIPLGKRNYINVNSVRSSLHKIKANKEERAMVEDLLTQYENTGQPAVTWQQLMADLEKAYVPFKRVQLGDDLVSTIEESEFEMDVPDGMTYYNPVTDLRDSTYSEVGIQYVGEKYTHFRAVSYETPMDLVDTSLDERITRLHFERPNQFGFVHEGDSTEGSRMLLRMQSDVAQRKLTDEQLAEIYVNREQKEKLVNEIIYEFQSGLNADRLANLVTELETLVHLPAMAQDVATALRHIRRYESSSRESFHTSNDRAAILAWMQDSVLDVIRTTNISVQLDDRKINFNLKAVTENIGQVENLFPKWRERLFRETLRNAALDGKKVLTLPDGNLLSNIEFGGSKDAAGRLRLTPAQEGIVRAHRNFYKWVQRNFKRTGMKEEQTAYGKLLHVPILVEDNGPITVLARRMDGVMGQLGFNPDESPAYVTDNLSGMWDWLKVRAAKIFLTPLQINERYQLEEIQDYLDKGVTPWWNTKMKIISNTEELVQEWNKLDKTRKNNLSKALLESTAKSDELTRRLSSGEISEILDRHDLDSESREIFEGIDREFQKLVDRLEVGILKNEARIHMGTSPQEFIDGFLNAKTPQQMNEVMFRHDISPMVGSNLLKIRSQFDELRNRNYFPYVRFGRYTITATAKDDMTYNGRRFKEGESVFLYTYESRPEQLEGQSDHASALKDKRLIVKLSKLDDTEMMFSGFPPTLMANLEESLNLTAEQKENLKHVMSNLSPGRSFMKHLQKRKGLEGFSDDTLRAFSSYMFSAANHIARVEHYLDMTKALERIGDLRKSPEYQDSVVIQELHSYFKKHYAYIMNPGTDLANIRSIGFMWYLGANVKSAAVNLTQVPMVAYPYLANRFGSDKAAISALTGAMKDVAGGLRGKPKYTNLENQLMTRAIEEGFIDESQVTELAGMGESHVLSRIMPQYALERGLNKAAYAAGYLFHQAELFNRRVTFLSALRLAQKQNPGNQEYAFQEAKRAVQSAQFEYAKWNRPEFMRGNKSVIFLFWQYMQHAAFLSMGGQGKGVAMRMLMMMLLAGGLQGLPFAENILDLIDFGATKTKEMLGMKDPKVELREELRILLQEITDQPDLVMHGVGRYLGLGPLHVFAALGVPVPQVDITSSLSMGRVVPGLEDMLSTTSDPEKKFARTIVEMGGPVVGLLWNFYRYATVEEPDEWKAMERTLPIALKNVSKATRLHFAERETNRSGATITQFEPGSPEHQAELMFQALGFAPTRANQKYEMMAAQQEARNYWLVNRSRLLEHYSYAVIVRDREGIADAKKAIRDYNKTTPTNKLHITGGTMAQSVKAKRSKVRKMEEDRATQKMFQPVYQNVQQAFPEAK